MKPERKFTRFSSPSTLRRLVKDVVYIGFVALKDLRKVAKDLGELTDDTVLQDMIERADADGDGVVSEEEFYNLITKKTH